MLTIFIPDKKLNLRVRIKNAIKFYAWVILPIQFGFLSILPTGISCFSRENDNIKQTNKIVLFSFFLSLICF